MDVELGAGRAEIAGFDPDRYDASDLRMVRPGNAQDGEIGTRELRSDPLRGGDSDGRSDEESEYGETRDDGAERLQEDTSRGLRTTPVTRPIRGCLRIWPQPTRHASRGVPKR